MKESNTARSVKARMLNMAKGENKRYQQLVVRYLHERLLFRLSKSNFRNKFILKGGTLLYAFEEFIPRPTLDIDFMGQFVDNDKSTLMSVFKDILSNENDDDGISFDVETMAAEDIIVDKKYPGVRIDITAKIGTYKQNLTIDIGFGDVIVPSPIQLYYPTVFESMEEPYILGYSLETVVAEKFQTMIERGRYNSRMKDYFDLFRIFSVHKFDRELLAKAVRDTFTNRGMEGIESDFFSDDFGQDITLNRQWTLYLRKIKIDFPPFPKIHRFIADELISCWEIMKTHS